MSVLRSRISALVEGFGLPEGSGRSLRALLEIVEQDPAAPTTVTDPTVGVEVHLADALDGLRLDVVRAARRIADLGSGAGFPGLVLAIALPDAHVALVESVGKKCAFMRRAAESAGLTNVETVHARAEDWPEGVGLHDLVTARAVAPLGVLIEYAAPLLTTGGHLVAWKAARERREEEDADAAAAATGLVHRATESVPPRPGADHHHLYVYSKVSETPPRFPRRPGMARKRPLSAST